MPIFKLTNEFLTNSLTCPDGKRRVKYCDSGGRDTVPGLYVEVCSTSPGQGTYYLRHKDVSAETCHQKLSRTTDIDLATACEKAKAPLAVPMRHMHLPASSGG